MVCKPMRLPRSDKHDLVRLWLGHAVVVTVVVAQTVFALAQRAALWGVGIRAFRLLQCARQRRWCVDPRGVFG